MNRRDCLRLTAIAATAGSSALTVAQHNGVATNWPGSKAIRLIVPFSPGGGTDILSRLIAQKLTEAKQWTVVAENKPGAGGTIGITEAVRAKPTGFDIVMGQKDNLVVAPWLYSSLSWNPTKDLVAIAAVAHTPILIATGAQSRFQTLADVVNAAKAAPGTITYGSPGNGTSLHLAADLFAKAARIELNHVPYKGSNPAIMDALAGTIDILVSSVPSAMGQLKAGKLRPLAVTSAKRSAILPEVPSVAESAVAGFDVSTWYGLLAPKGTPQAIIDLINAEVNKLLQTPEVQAAIHAQGAEPLILSSAEFAQLLHKEYQEWQAIVKNSGVTLD